MFDTDKVEELIVKEIKYMDAQLLYLCYRGSVAHNMYVPSTDPNSVDDIDLLGVYVLPARNYLGLTRGATTVEMMEEIDGVLWDVVLYEVKHFVGMMLNNNPNILSSIFCKNEHILYMHEAFNFVRDYRDDCLTSERVRKSFTGYANDQLKRMTHQAKHGRMGEKRKAIVDKFGYDTKNAAHLIRLLKVGIELLETGKVNVYRTEDRQVLLNIKTGKWKLEEVKQYADILFSRMDKFRNGSAIKDEVNLELIDIGLLTMMFILLMD